MPLLDLKRKLILSEAEPSNQFLNIEQFSGFLFIGGKHQKLTPDNLYDKGCWAVHRINGRSKELGLEKKTRAKRVDCCKRGQGFTASNVNLAGFMTLVLLRVQFPVFSRSLCRHLESQSPWWQHLISKSTSLPYLSGLLAFTSRCRQWGIISQRKLYRKKKKDKCPPYFWTRYPGIGFIRFSAEQYYFSGRWSWARWGWVMWGSCSKEGHILYLWMITLNFCRTEK